VSDQPKGGVGAEPAQVVERRDHVVHCVALPAQQQVHPGIRVRRDPKDDPANLRPPEKEALIGRELDKLPSHIAHQAIGPASHRLGDERRAGQVSGRE